jgi:hypothetical protein
MAAIDRRRTSSTDALPMLVRLYPAAWRARYGDEFAELLASRPPRLRDRLDILAGAVDARIHPQVGGGAPNEAAMRWDQSAGGLIVVGGAFVTVWAAIALSFMGPWAGVDETAQGMLNASFTSGLVGSILLAVALLLIASRYDWLIGSSGAVGGVLTGAGLVFSALGGGMAALLLLGGGTLLLAWRLRGRLVGTLSAATLVAATVLLVGAFLLVWANGWTDQTPFYLVVAYGPAWMLFGRALRVPAREAQPVGA